MAKDGRKKFTVELLVKRGIFPETWKEDIIELGKQGKNKIYFANYLNIGRDTLYKLMDRDKKFNDTIRLALQLSQQWWIEKLRDNFDKDKSGKMNSTLYKFYMMNVYRDDYRSEQQIDITSKGEKLESTKELKIEIIDPQAEKEKEKEEDEGEEKEGDNKKSEE